LPRKFKRFETMKFELDTKERKEVGLDIVSHRQKQVEVLEDNKERLLEEMRSQCPEIALQLTAVENNLKKQKKHLKDTNSGLRRKPFSVIADVIVQMSETKGYIEFIENSGTGVVLLEESGTEDQISTEE
jgi:hypothetical protein